MANNAIVATQTAISLGNSICDIIAPGRTATVVASAQDGDGDDVDGDVSELHAQDEARYKALVPHAHDLSSASASELAKLLEARIHITANRYDLC
jgi:phage-related minor tail protein